MAWPGSHRSVASTTAPNSTSITKLVRHRLAARRAMSRAAAGQPSRSCLRTNTLPSTSPDRNTNCSELSDCPQTPWISHSAAHAPWAWLTKMDSCSQPRTRSSRVSRAGRMGIAAGRMGIAAGRKAAWTTVAADMRFQPACWRPAVLVRTERLRQSRSMSSR